LLSKRVTSTSFPTNGKGDTEKVKEKVVTVTTFMCSQESRDDSSSEGKRDDSEITTQDSEEVPPDQGSNNTTLEAPEEKEASSSSADKAEIVAMPMETEEDLQRERERIVATTVAIPIYTKEIIRDMIGADDVVKEDEKESFHTKLLERMRLRKNLSIVNSGFASADNMVAVSEDLFPFIARGYIHSEYCAIDTFKTSVHEIQDSHEASQKDFAECFSALSKDMFEQFSALSNDMREVHVNTQDTIRKELLRIQDVTDISKQSDKFKLKTALALYNKNKAESAENAYKRLEESLQQRDPQDGESDTERRKKLTERANDLQGQLSSVTS